MTMRVAFIFSRLSPTIACVRLSSALVASSKKISRGRLTSARAIIRRWRWPPESWLPPSVTIVSRPIGMAAMSASKPARRVASITWSRVKRGAARDVLVDVPGIDAGRLQHRADLAANQPEIERLEVLSS